MTTTPLPIPSTPWADRSAALEEAEGGYADLCAFEEWMGSHRDDEFSAVWNEMGLLKRIDLWSRINTIIDTVSEGQANQ